jgi:type IV pilus assembly protein PilV
MRRGFTLVEVLVALFVVAVGLAGAAALHARALRAAEEAAYLSDGVQVAAALAERMRANRAAMALDDAANPYFHPDAGAATCFAAPGCAPDALARFDLAETNDAIAARLPGGRVVACRDGAGLPAWECDGDAAAPAIIKVGWRTAGVPDTPRVLLPVGAGR